MSSRDVEYSHSGKPVRPPVFVFLDEPAVFDSVDEAERWFIEFPSGDGEYFDADGQRLKAVAAVRPKVRFEATSERDADGFRRAIIAAFRSAGLKNDPNASLYDLKEQAQKRFGVSTTKPTAAGCFAGMLQWWLSHSSR